MADKYNFNCIRVFLNNEAFRYHIYEILLVFFKPDKISFILNSFEENTDSDDLSLYCSVEELSDDKYLIRLKYLLNGEVILSEDLNSDEGMKESRKHIKEVIYRNLSVLTGITSPWGSLTGIRPAKLVNMMMKDGLSENEIKQTLKDKYLVSETKSEFVYETAATQAYLLNGRDKGKISVYIGIPFCPTRCLYCSFTSNPINKYRKMIDRYIDSLLLEIDTVANYIRELKPEIESIYIGGGTPTSLSAEHLDKLLRKVKELYSVSSSQPKEFCVEAGRPDSIDEDKLRVMHINGVNRISVNPQTLNDKTLELIGRRHSNCDFYSAFQLARDMGFTNINTDIIAGLPGETFEMFKYTMDNIIKLSPENITVHTMSIKKASLLKQEVEKYDISDSREVEKMISYAYKAAKESNLHPYYLYRQKNMLGNLENTGYSKPGLESYYNVHIMEEDQTVLAFGAGGISKFVYHDTDKIERVFNIKGVEEYIDRIDEMSERKINELKRYINS